MGRHHARPTPEPRTQPFRVVARVPSSDGPATAPIEIDITPAEMYGRHAR